MKNFGQMKASLDVWAREPLDDALKSDALNDAIEALWMAILKVHIDSFMGGPTTIQLAAATERFQLTSIADPVIQLAVAAVAGGALNPRNLQISFTKVTESGSETLMSPPVALALLANQIASFTAPAPDPNAIGWNLYAGSTVALMCQQNKSVLSFFGPTPNEPVTGFKDAPDGGPLPPTENTTADNIFYIRHLELPLSAGGYKPWNSGDIDGTLMRMAARSIASTSEYQDYVWDLVNGRQLEFRPVLGTAVAPRYFFINKPRRIRFDQSPIPFERFPSEAFLRYHCLSALVLVNEEWQASQGWNTKAESEKSAIISTVSQMNYNKEKSITPFMR